MSDAVEFLASTDAWGPFSRSPDASRAIRVAEAWGQQLPQDFSEILTAFGGGDLMKGTTLQFMTMSQLVNDWDADYKLEKLPGAIAFGHDGGGAFYYYDTRGILGFGEWAVFLVRVTDSDRAGSIYVGKSVVEAIEALLQGEDFFDRPELGEAKT